MLHKKCKYSKNIEYISTPCAPPLSLFSAQISPVRLQISSYCLKISLSSDLDFSPINLLLSPNRYCMSPSDLTFTLKSLTRASSDS